MTAQYKLNKAARAHGWANWSEVLMHNAPAHVINLIVEEAMRDNESKKQNEQKPIGSVVFHESDAVVVG